MAHESWPHLDPEQIDAVLAFLPIFEQDGYSFGDWVFEEGRVPYYAYDADVERFVIALHEQGFIQPFDWQAWAHTASRYVEEPRRLAEANLETLRKLLTTHVRADRLNEGHLAEVLESGHVVEVLRRVGEIRYANQSRSSTM